MKNWGTVEVYNTNQKEKQKLFYPGEFAKFLNSMKDGTDYSLTTIDINDKIKGVNYYQKKGDTLYHTKVNPNSLWWKRRTKLKNLKNKLNEKTKDTDS